MNIVKPSVTLVKDKDPKVILKNIERCGRLCYQSEGKVTSDSFIPFVKGLVTREHLAVIEHESVTAIVICDRGCCYEIVRHRLGSYCQESTRYVNYKEGLTVIRPCFFDDDSLLMEAWKVGMQYCEDTYRAMISLGAKPQEARTVLPNSLKTEIAITYNMREWRHFLKLRLSKGAHPQIREVARLLLKELQDYIPIIFDDIKEEGKE